ncbi:flagellar hook-associated protein FlgK [Agromyces sp. NPDC056379]|uniref:flagellar hook-associated protein FlgK n=1 Tax=unclassified Agromyces TaxID=2639701 RepID=UPI0035E38ADF
MSTFGGLNTSFTALNAARTAIEVAGQNVANVKTPGYTRQRAELVANGALGAVGLLAPPRPGIGQGVTVSGIARLADEMLNGQVRATSSTAGYHAARAIALGRLEGGLNEPGANGIAAQLQEFWSSWQGLANAAGDGAATAVVLEEANALISRIAQGYRDVTAQWKSLRAEANTMVSSVNNAAERVATLNDTIRRVGLAGGNTNELADERDRYAAELASTAGGVVHANSDGTVDVLIGGNPVVSGTSWNRVVLAGPTTPDGGSVTLEWERRPGTPVALDGGELAGAVSMLAPATASGNGGQLAEALASYNGLAEALAVQVNTLHRSGSTTGGQTGLDFFSVDPTRPAALGLGVIPTDAAGIASGAVGAGPLDGSMADAIAQLRLADDAPDAHWATFVAKVGVAAGAEHDRAVVAELAMTSAVARQQSSASVDLDEENMNLVLAQTAYQGAARVFTAIDEMLDVLINRTGIVGR